LKKTFVSKTANHYTAKTSIQQAIFAGISLVEKSKKRPKKPDFYALNELLTKKVVYLLDQLSKISHNFASILIQ
jgi:hypothetical protein